MHDRVLVPLDGLEYSLKALDVAGDLAGKYGSKLILLHVVPSGEVPKALQKKMSEDGAVFGSPGSDL